VTVYKRGKTYWADFVVGGRRLRVSLKTSDRRQALALEKIRIAEAQTGVGMVPPKATSLTVAEASEVYFTRRLAEVSASTIRLERDAAKQLLRHTGTNLLSDLTPDSLTGYVQPIR
jgi:hypothetical protein